MNMMKVNVLVDEDFTENGVPISGADIHDNYMRVHPNNLDQLLSGLQLFFNSETFVYHKLEDIPTT